MTAVELLASLRSRGYDLAAKDGGTRLVVIHSGTPLTDADRELVRQYRDALLLLLWAEEPPCCWVEFGRDLPPIERLPLSGEERAELWALVNAEAERLAWPELWNVARHAWKGWERVLLEQLRKP